MTLHATAALEDALDAAKALREAETDDDPEGPDEGSGASDTGI